MGPAGAEIMVMGWGRAASDPLPAEVELIAVLTSV
jgi:hypothetical protein